MNEQRNGGDSGPDKRLLEDVLDEVLSFNFRSLRTLRDIFVRPGHVTRVFADGDRETYTPTMRIWFGVVSWLFLLSIIWGGFGELIIRASEAAGDPISRFTVDGRRDMDQVASALSATAAALYIPLNSALIIMGVHVLRGFNNELSFIQTAQGYFIPLTAMTVSSTFFVIASVFDARALLVAPFANYACFFLIAFDVVRRVFSRNLFGAFMRTLILTFVVFVLSTMATVLTFLISIVAALMTVQPNF